MTFRGVGGFFVGVIKANEGSCSTGFVSRLFDYVGGEWRVNSIGDYGASTRGYGFYVLNTFTRVEDHFVGYLFGVGKDQLVYLAYCLVLVTGATRVQAAIIQGGG